MSVTDVAFRALVSSSAAGGLVDSHAAARERRRRSRRSDDRSKDLLAQVGRWFLSCQAQPHLVVDRSQRVLAMNRPAQLLFKGSRSMELRGGNLFFASATHTVELGRVLGGEVERVSFSVISAGSRLIVCAVRIHASTPMFLVSAATVPHDNVERLRSEFGLTAAESEVAFSVYAGLSLVRISKQRGASINTVKTQARYVFQKCGVRSQVELTRRIGEVLMRG